MGKKNKYKIVLTDKNNPNSRVEISFIDGVLSTDRIITTETKENITEYKK